MNWDNNVKMCLNLGMTPLRLDSAEVKTVFDSFANGKYSQTLQQSQKIFQTALTWKGALNYWTAGRRSENLNTSGNFNWCSAENSTELVSDNVHWQAGQADNLGGNQNCLHLRIMKNASKTVVTDRNCTSKFTFACQVLVWDDL